MSAALSLGLIGWPLEHSLSPHMHEAALQEMGIQGSYRLYPIPTGPGSETALRDLLEEVRRRRIHGLNVTIPYKWDVQQLADSRSKTVKIAGAANTLYMQGERLVAENTDIPGLHASIHGSLIASPGQGAEDKPILILGAGGAARAAVVVAYQLERCVILAARRLEQAEKLKAEISARIPVSIETVRLDRAGLDGLPELALIVNTTPVGMYPHANASPWPDDVAMPAAGLYDMIYNPPDTYLMQQARRSGARVANGLDMLVEQAALSLEIWTGCPVSRPVMKSAALAELARRSQVETPSH